jgi:hypothetical protein
MKWILIRILIIYPFTSFGQPPTKEAFVNEVSSAVVDSRFSKYYLSIEAKRCRFKQFDYDELIKYSLKEVISLDMLNELARHVFEDSASHDWAPEKLTRAICIGQDQIRDILNPTWEARYNNSLSEREKQKAIKKRMNQWNKKPAQEKWVYFFSMPEFTDDGQYAVIDLDFRCDEHECGKLSTYLLRKEKGKWKTVGIITAR